jgi:septal ring factor EnvC (AmiA/AmiB activator)
MANEVDFVERIPSILGWCTPLFIAVTAWFAGRRKNDIDESTVVLNQWKALLEAHKAQMSDQAVSFEKKMQDAKDEIEKLGKKIIAHEERIEALEKENKVLREENEGYRRQMLQRSQSEMQVVLPSVTVKRAPTSVQKFKDPDEDLIKELGGWDDAAI